MAVDNFIPQLWAAELLENLNDAHVYGSCFNRDYEGDISAYGDSVRINSIGRITINSHTKNSAINAPETLVGAGQTLIIDQANYYNFEIDDVDAAQVKPKLMAAAMEEAAWGLSDAMDAYLGATTLEDFVATANKLTALTSCGTGASDDDVYEALVDLKVKLTENNVPTSGRWVVVPPWFHGLLLKDPRFVSFGTGENRTVLKNGEVGRAAGFDIKESNNVPVSGSAYTIIAGHKIAATLAEQINDPKAYEPEDAFGDAMKGLHLYGAKTTRPNALASVVCTAA
jgi:hypothetical protein